MGNIEKMKLKKCVSLSGENMIVKGIFAGIFIALGCCGYVMTGNYVTGAILFSIGLLMIKQYGLYLFTGRVGNVKSFPDALHCFVVLLLNLIGVALVFLLIKHSGALTSNLQRVYISKIEYTNLRMFLMAIPCGFIMSFAARKETTTIQTIMCVTLFIVCGFEHCIADCFYLAFAVDGHLCLFIQKLVMAIIGNVIGATIGSRWLFKTKEAKCEKC